MTPRPGIPMRPEATDQCSRRRHAVRLEPVCDMQLSYQGSFSLVKPYGGEEGSGYGNGDGRAEGPRLSGAVQWAEPSATTERWMHVAQRGGSCDNEGRGKGDVSLATADGVRRERERGAG